MFSFLPGPLRGILALSLYLFNTLFWFPFIIAVAVSKILIPYTAWQVASRKITDAMSTWWVDLNNLNLKLMQNVKFEVTGMASLKQDKWYLVVCNHQSWVDILVMQKVLLRKIPFLKFFIKKELIWVPLMGLAWWALDFPFMKRYSSEFLKKNPHLRGRDIEITRKACTKFKTIPVSIVNFMEGTRFTPAKHSRQKSPYRRLLKPKAGGVAFVLKSMNNRIDEIVDVTIVYPEGSKTFWQFLCGDLTHIKVHIRVLPVTENLTGNYFEDHEFRENFQGWVNDLWQTKDKQIGEMLRKESLYEI